jgi:hypothetical protein
VVPVITKIPVEHVLGDAGERDAREWRRRGKRGLLRAI